MDKLKISACIITYNEALNIANCIDSLNFVDEILIIDSNSTDKTREIAEQFGATVYINDFKGHIEQKNFALSKAKHNWVISLDADEAISENLKKEIEDLFKDKSHIVNKYSGFSIPRRPRYLGKWISHGGWYPDRHIRLFKKSHAKWGGENPHDKIILNGLCGKLKNDFYHYSFHSLSDHIRTINRFSGIMARNLYRNKKNKFPLLKLLFKAPWKFIEIYFLKLAFLDGIHGFIIAVFSSFASFAKFAKLFELNLNGDDGKYKDAE